MPDDRDNPVRQARLNKGWTQDELAANAKIKTGTVSKAENGHKISDLSKHRISQALGRSVDEVFPNGSGENE